MNTSIRHLCLIALTQLLLTTAAFAGAVTISPIAPQNIQLADKRAFTFEVTADSSFKGSELNVVINRKGLNGVDKDKEVTVSSSKIAIAPGGKSVGKIMIESAFTAPSFENANYEVLLTSDRAGNLTEAQQTVTLSVKPIVEFWMIGSRKWALAGDQEFGLRELPLGGTQASRTYNLRTHNAPFKYVDEYGKTVEGTGVTLKFINFDEKGGMHITHGGSPIPHGNLSVKLTPSKLFQAPDATSIYAPGVAASAGAKTGHFYYHDQGPGDGSAAVQYINFNSK